MNRTITKSPVCYIIIWKLTVRLELLTLAGWLHQCNMLLSLVFHSPQYQNIISYIPVLLHTAFDELHLVIYRVIQKDRLNFVRLYFLNYTWYVNDLHNI